MVYRRTVLLRIEVLHRGSIRSSNGIDSNRMRSNDTSSTGMSPNSIGSNGNRIVRII